MKYNMCWIDMAAFIISDFVTIVNSFSKCAPFLTPDL